MKLRTFANILLLFSFATISLAQTQTPKKEKDGFEWIHLSQDGYEGAADKKGNILISLSNKYKSVCYIKLDSQDKGFFYVGKDGMFSDVGICDKSGKEVIPTGRGYSSITYHVTTEGYKYFQVEKNNLNGACDTQGNEIVGPKYYNLFYSQGRFIIQKSEESQYEDLNITLVRNDSFSSKKIESNGFEWIKVYKGECCGAQDKDGHEIIPMSRGYNDIIYDENDYGGYPYFKVRKNNKYGACDLNGVEAIKPIYHGVYTFKNGFETQLTESSDFVETNIKFSSDGIWRKNVATTIGTSSLQEILNQAEATPDSESQKKYNLYKQIVDADPYNSLGFKAIACNQIAILYYNLGDTGNAKAWLEECLRVSPGNPTATNNLKIVKSQRRQQRINAITGVLGAIGSAVSGTTTGGSVGSYQGGAVGNDNGSTGSYGGGSGGSTCKRCNGSGKCSSSSITADKYYCHGSGRCGYCNGDGVKRHLGQVIKCTSCNGDGRCHYCNGSGKCSSCGGRGTI